MSHTRALGVALADDFALRYQDELAREQLSSYAPEPGDKPSPDRALSCS
jgi:hypothetical protein